MENDLEGQGSPGPRRPPDRACGVCGRPFKRAGALKRHEALCTARAILGPAKRRAWELFNHWMARSGLGPGKTLEKFEKSPYRNIFIRLEKTVQGTYVPSGKAYIDWLVVHSIPSRDWSKNSVIERYKHKHSREQDPKMLAMRSLEKIAAWCDKHGIDMANFFAEIGPGDALVWIEAGKLTPWVLLTSERTEQLLSRMDEAQLERFQKLVDLGYWDARLRVSEHVREITGMVREVGL